SMLPTETLPEDGRRSQAKMRSAVVLPAPFRPRKPTVSPSPISNDTGPSARLDPKYLETFCARIMRSPLLGDPRECREPWGRQPYQPRQGCQGFPATATIEPTTHIRHRCAPPVQQDPLSPRVPRALWSGYNRTGMSLIVQKFGGTSVGTVER